MHVENHGCRLNQADGDGLEAALRRAGHEVVAASEAELVVVNTCSITHRAGADARQRARAHGRSGRRVVVTGCHANAAPEEFRGLDGVEAIVGNERKESLTALIDDAAVRGSAAPAGQLIAAERLLRRRAGPTLPLNLSPRRSRAYLKVQDGCNYRCSFCIVPSVRGRSVSVPLEEVGRRASALASTGVPEIVITGVHLGTYGWDHGLRPGLTALVETVLAQAPSVRVRLGSIDPHEVDASLLDLMASESRICPHLHLPIQSGDDAVLRRMRRAHRVADLEALVPEIRRRLPHAAVGSDIIVGHPGEDEAAFERTRALAGALLDYAHVFTFSARPGTAAAEMNDPVPAQTRRRRNASLRAVMDKNWRAFRERLVGTEHVAVVHRRRHRERGTALATTAHGVRVEIGAADDALGGCGDFPIDDWLGRALPVRVDAVRGEATLASPRPSAPV